MEDRDPQNERKSVLPDALHTEIGNGAAWSLDDHERALRSVDPLKLLDNSILDEQLAWQIQSQWTMADGKKTEETAPPPFAEETEKTIQNESSLPKVPLEEERDIPIEIQLDSDAQDFNTKTSEISYSPIENDDFRQPESSGALSPFTNWLKRLKGSEYVHPYDDDFALEQLSGPGKGQISETLADLLASQGYKERAIEMYEALMSEFPEKSSFFAAKIKALK